MNHPESERKYIEELKAFLLFLKDLWGLLAGISVFFPLSNILLRTIPLGAYGNDGVFDQLPPSLLTTLATVVTLFVVLVTFAGRRRFQDPRERHGTLRAAWLSFGIGTLALLTYLIVHQAYREYAWEPWGWGSGDPRKLFAEIPLLITYVMFFSLLTRAFTLLGMIEFFGNMAGRDRS
jgi:magnesium-transporting ATPase (P-type)